MFEYQAAKTCSIALARRPRWGLVVLTSIAGIFLVVLCGVEHIQYVHDNNLGSVPFGSTHPPPQPRQQIAWVTKHNFLKPWVTSNKIVDCEKEPFSDSVLPLSNGVVRLVGSHVARWLRYDSNNILHLPRTRVLPLNYTFWLPVLAGPHSLNGQNSLKRQWEASFMWF